MTTFGNFAPLEQDTQPGQVPADIGLGVKGNNLLVEQAWAFSPANLFSQSNTSDMPASGNGSGSRARLDDAILRNYENRLNANGPFSLSGPLAPDVPAGTEAKTLRSVLPPVGSSGRAADTTTSNRPADLFEALSGTKSGLDARTPSPLPTNPFATGAQMPGSERTVVYNPAPAYRAETGPLPVVARTEANRGTATALDVKAHPLFANLNKDAKTASPYNYNARDSRSIEDLSRRIMTADFSPPRAWAQPTQALAQGLDPFMAPNLHQSMEFRPDGSVATTTTLLDLSASKTECSFADKSKSVALADYLGRPTVEQRFDATGQLVSQTSCRFDHQAAPMIASQKIIQTATQTIETKMNESGTVVASKIMPYSDLNATKSIA